MVYNIDSAKTNLYSNAEEKLPFKKLVYMKKMTMQFPLNHKYALTSDNRLFVIGGTFNLINSYRHTYEIVDEDCIIEKRSMFEARNSFGCIPLSTSILVIGGYHKLRTTLST